ncbi:unnamed protein product [Lampetra planeri]
MVTHLHLLPAVSLLLAVLAVESSVNIFMSEDEVKKLLGLKAQLYYVRDGVVCQNAFSFVLPVPGDMGSLHFTWHASTPVEYRLGFQVDDPIAMDPPTVNVTWNGEVPRLPSVFRVNLPCTGRVESDVALLMQLNLTATSTATSTATRHRHRGREKTSPPSTSSGGNPAPDVRAHTHTCRHAHTGTRTHMYTHTPAAAATTSTRVFYISVGVCCAVIFLVALVLALLHIHSMKKVEEDSLFDSESTQGLSQPSTQTTQCLRADTPNNAAPITNYPSLKIEKNDLKPLNLPEAKSRVRDIAVARERVTLKQVLQEGTFGRIYHGVLVDEKDPKVEKEVFVKTVNEHASEVQVVLMLTESCKLRGLHHRNLLPICAVCVDEGERPLVLLPLMSWGNLKLFLRQCKLAEANNPQSLSQQDLVNIAIQIACGMSYLTKREVVHRDLAARNCVIDEGLHVKITDTALARDLFPMDYHCLGDNVNRPVRWMALEGLLHHDFSPASDVWAFGVTLWELMTLGQTPYAEIDPFEMAAYLKDGFRIPQPCNCPDELFAVMACCWALDPEERPKFTQLVQCLTEFHAALTAYV